MKIINQIILVLASFSFLYPCSCEELPSPEEAYEMSNVVFSGQVTNIIEDWNNGFIEISIDVYNVWKGTVDNQIIILTGLDDCGYYFQLNEEYLIYGYYSQLNHIWTDICTRTNLLEDAEEDLDYLNNLSNTQTYIFNENIRVTQSSNDQKFPEIAIDDNIIHLSWVSINGGNKNIMYSRSEDSGESFSIPVQINYLDNNIVAFGQSGPKVKIYENKVYITYTDDRNGYTSVFTNVSYDLGLTWNEEVLITDTDYLNAYHDLEVHSDGSLHFIYYNYGASNNLENVKYRYSESDISEMSPSIPLGIVTTEMMPCHCCQPDLEIDQNGDIYVIYRNNIQNIRDTYLAVKRYSDNTFSEYYQVSDTQDYIGFCPSSGPSLDINNEEIAISYTSYNDENAYISLSTLDDLDFSDYSSLNPSSITFQNYPYILLDDNNIHAVWVEQDDWDIYYGMRDVESGIMMDIQKINDDDSNSTQREPIIYKENDVLYSFWSDNRNGNYEIYFSRGLNESILPGDINQDDSIDILDIVIMVNIILGQYQPDTQEIIASDLNNDNLINIQDIILLINIILNN